MKMQIWFNVRSGKQWETCNKKNSKREDHKRVSGIGRKGEEDIQFQEREHQR